MGVAHTRNEATAEDEYDEELAYVTEVQTVSAASKSGQKALKLYDVLLDSGASVSIFNNVALLTNIVPAYKPVYIGGCVLQALIHACNTPRYPDIQNTYSRYLGI